MSEGNKCTKQIDVNSLIDEFNDTKKSPYIFLILITFPFFAYLLPETYFEGQRMWIIILVMLAVNYQVDIYLLNKKVNILSRIIKR